MKSCKMLPILQIHAVYCVKPEGYNDGLKKLIVSQFELLPGVCMYMHFKTCEGC